MKLQFAQEIRQIGKKRKGHAKKSANDCQVQDVLKQTETTL
jgi:hypothetical protein